MKILFNLAVLAITTLFGAEAYAEMNPPISAAPMVSPPLDTTTNQFAPAPTFGLSTAFAPPSIFGTTQSFGPSSSFDASPMGGALGDNGSFRGFSSLPTGSSTPLIPVGSPSSAPSGFNSVRGAPSTVREFPAAQ